MTSSGGERLEAAAPGFDARSGLPLGAVVETLLPEAAIAALSDAATEAVLAEDTS